MIFIKRSSQQKQLKPRMGIGSKGRGSEVKERIEMLFTTHGMSAAYSLVSEVTD